MKKNLTKKIIGTLILSATLNTTNLFADAKAIFVANCGLQTRYKATAKIRKPTGTFPWKSWTDKGCTWAEVTKTDMDVPYPSNNGGNAFSHVKKAAGVWIEDYWYQNGWSAGEPWEKLDDNYAFIPIETETGNTEKLDIFSSAKVTGNDEDIDMMNKSLTLKNINGQLLIRGKDYLQGNVSFYLEVRQFLKPANGVDIDKIEDWDDLQTDELFYHGALHIIGGKLVTEGNFTEDMFILTESDNQITVDINIEEVKVNFITDKVLDFDRIIVSSGVDGDLIGNGSSQRYAIKNPNNISLQELVQGIQSKLIYQKLPK